jgi:hypothetical protein
MEWLIVTLLAIGWYFILSKRHKLVTSKKKQKRQLESLANMETNTFTPPEYFIWELTNPDQFGD